MLMLPMLVLGFGAPPAKTPTPPAIVAAKKAETPVIPKFLNHAPVRLSLSPKRAGQTDAKEIKPEIAWNSPAPAPCFSLQFSPDGKRLAVGGYDHIVVWNLETGVPELLPVKFDGAIQSLAYSPDGASMAVSSGVAGKVTAVQIIQLKTGASLPLKGHTDLVYSVVFSPDGNLVGTAGHDHTARLWDAKTGKEVRQLTGHGEAVTQLVFSYDGKSVFTACMDRSIRRFETATGAMMRTMSGLEKGALCLLSHPDGNKVIASGEDSRLRWFSNENGEAYRDDYGHREAVNAMCMSQDKQMIATASGDHRVILWGEGGGYRREFKDSEDWMYTVGFRPNSKQVAFAGSEGSVFVHDRDNGELRLTLFASVSPKTGEFNWAAVTPQGWLTASDSVMKSLKILANQLPVADVEFAKLTLPDNVLKAWKNEPLNNANLPDLPEVKAPEPKKPDLKSPEVKKPAKKP